MSLLNEIVTYNRQFVENKDYEEFLTDKFPDKRMVILTCMDTRLVELLPKAMNLRNGDAKIIKSAGAIISHPFGSVMRSIMVAVYELQAKEIFVIGHHGCGMTALNPQSVLAKASERGISDETISTIRNSGIDLDRWLTGFDDVKESVTRSVNIVRSHPLLPKDVPVHGLIMNPETGLLDIVKEGFAE